MDTKGHEWRWLGCSRGRVPSVGSAEEGCRGPYRETDGRRLFSKLEPVTSDLADHSDAREGDAGSESLICAIREI